MSDVVRRGNKQLVVVCVISRSHSIYAAEREKLSQLGERKLGHHEEAVCVFAAVPK